MAVNVAEVLQAAAGAAARVGGVMTNRSRQVRVPLDTPTHKVRDGEAILTTHTTRDEPAVLVDVAGASAAFAADALDPAAPRWVAEVRCGDAVERSVVAGTGDVDRVVVRAAELAGVMVPADLTPPSQLNGFQP